MLKSHIVTVLRPVLDVPPTGIVDGYRRVEIRAYTKGEPMPLGVVQVHFGETHEARVIASFKPWEARELARLLVEAATTSEE
jgi:hypothetical protein